jgi:hypothetical protein
MDDLLLPLLGAVTAAVLVLLIGVVAFLLRRLVLARGLGTFDCSLRGRTSRRAGGWILGVARYEADRLDWFRVFTMSPRPARSLARADLEILDSRVPEGQESYSFFPGWVIVRCSYRASVLELAMSDPAYNGLAAWLESAPPGTTAHLAG